MIGSGDNHPGFAIHTGVVIIKDQIEISMQNIFITAKIELKILGAKRNDFVCCI